MIFCFKLILAERKGFEPLVRFWRTHTFQACALDHSATSPYSYQLNLLIPFDGNSAANLQRFLFLFENTLKFFIK